MGLEAICQALSRKNMNPATRETTLNQRYQQLIQRINQAARAAGCEPGQIHLLAVSKKHPLEKIAALHTLGQQCFGESYAQEGVKKIQQWHTEHPETPLQWHFIGPLQSNKTRLVAEHFDWVQSVDSLKLLQRLNRQRPSWLPPLNICLQYQPVPEAGKRGVDLSELVTLAAACQEMPRLQLRGVMSIPPKTTDKAVQFAHFERVRKAYETLKQDYPLDTLSMGMSGDLETAVAAGSTLLRIGTALFGPRPA